MKMKIETSIFHGIHNPHILSDCIADMDYNFNQYRMFNERKVQFARMRLVKPIRIYWALLERDCKRDMDPIELKGEMIGNFKF